MVYSLLDAVRALALTALLLMPSSGALACACCTEPGQRLDVVAPLDSYLRDELGRIAIAPVARLYTDAGFPETIEGVDEPSTEGYDIEMSRTADRITLRLLDPAGQAGGIELTVPAEITRLEVDPRDGDTTEAGLGPVLYKEWRLEGEARLSGFLAAGSGRADASLILHGRGRGCTSAEDFTHWTLAVRGVGVRFTLLGETRAAP